MTKEKGMETEKASERHLMEFAQLGDGKKLHLLARMPESTYRVGMRCATVCDRDLLRTVKAVEVLPTDDARVCRSCRRRISPQLQHDRSEEE